MFDEGVATEGAKGKRRKVDDDGGAEAAIFISISIRLEIQRCIGRFVIGLYPPHAYADSEFLDGRGTSGYTDSE